MNTTRRCTKRVPGTRDNRWFRALASVLPGVVLLTAFLSAGPEERLFEEGNQLYLQGDFQGAAAKYHQIEAREKVSPELFYNLGNCYYKMQQTGKAVLYYERALRLDPGDEDISANLDTANQAIVDRIVPPEEFQFSRLLERAIFFVPSPALESTAMIAYYLAALLGVLLIIRKPADRARRMILRFLTVSLTLLSLSLMNAGLQWYERSNRVEAVIMAREASVLSAPEADSAKVFTLHEGTKVRLGQHSGEWMEIILVDGKVGWVRKADLETI